MWVSAMFFLLAPPCLSSCWATTWDEVNTALLDDPSSRSSGTSPQEDCDEVQVLATNSTAVDGCYEKSRSRYYVHPPVLGRSVYTSNHGEIENGSTLGLLEVQDPEDNMTLWVIATLYLDDKYNLYTNNYSCLLRGSPWYTPSDQPSEEPSGYCDVDENGVWSATPTIDNVSCGCSRIEGGEDDRGGSDSVTSDSKYISGGALLALTSGVCSLCCLAGRRKNKAEETSNAPQQTGKAVKPWGAGSSRRGGPPSHVPPPEFMPWRTRAPPAPPNIL